MARSRKQDRRDQEQDQDQDQKQAELQAQLQGQLQGQGQGQLQGQAQFALNDNKNENSNENDNKLDNDVDNKLDNNVENKVENDTSVENKLDNAVDNKVDNSLSNEVENKVENTVETKVSVDVDVDVDLKLDSLPDIEFRDAIYFDQIHDIDGSVVLTDLVQQTVSRGNTFNIDQVNNLVDNDFLFSASMKNDGEVDQKIDHVGYSSARADDAKAEIGHDGDMASGVAASADAIADQAAFTQNIVMGANIQFNSITQTVAGAGMSANEAPLDDWS